MIDDPKVASCEPPSSPHLGQHRQSLIPLPHLFSETQLFTARSMKGPVAFHVLLTVGVFGAATIGIRCRLPLPVLDANLNGATTGPLHDVDEYFDEDDIAAIQKNFHGWVNPEDLVPMPQCIAQQDQSAWLKAMTACTHTRCTSHFGFICTHHQWLTELSCLSTEFSPSAIQDYLPYCTRSILAKAQLYHWIRNVTG